MAVYRINKYLPDAIDLLEKCNIAQKGKIEKTFRGQISSFGAAVQMGSLTAAVAFFSEKGGAKSHREHLMLVLYNLVYKEKGNYVLPITDDKGDVTNKEVFKYLLEKVIGDKEAKKDEIIDAAVAVKLAMSAYVLE